MRMARCYLLEEGMKEFLGTYLLMDSRLIPGLCLLQVSQSLKRTSLNLTHKSTILRQGAVDELHMWILSGRERVKSKLE